MTTDPETRTCAPGHRELWLTLEGAALGYCGKEGESRRSPHDPSFVLGRMDPRVLACSAAPSEDCFNFEEEHLKHLLNKIQRLKNSVSDITLILILSFTKWVQGL